MGLLEPADWGPAKWINLPAGPVNTPVVVNLGAQDARYVRLDVSKLGLALNEGGSLGVVSRLQLAELALTDSSAGGANRSQGATVTASNPFVTGAWSPRRARRRRVDDAGLQQPRVQGPERQPVVLGPARPRRHPSLRHAAALSAHRSQDALTDASRTSRSTTRCRLRRLAGRADHDRHRPRSADPARPGLTVALPIFARAFTAPKAVSRARLYVAGLGAVRGDAQRPQRHRHGAQPRRDSNPLKSVEYGTYDVTSWCARARTRSASSSATGRPTCSRPPTPPRDAPTSTRSTPASSAPAGTLVAAAVDGATDLKVSSVSGYTVGATINVDTGGGGGALESRVIAAVGTAGATGTGITVTPALGTRTSQRRHARAARAGDQAGRWRSRRG